MTPVLRFNQGSIEWIKKVYDHIHQNYRTWGDESCGVHIHDGDGDRGLKDQVVKNLAATIWAFEALLDKLHPKFRYNDDACQSLHRNAVLREEEKAEANTFDFLTEAERVELLLSPEISRREAIDLINNPFPETGHAYDLENLVIPYVHPFKRTIEFRQHEMTFELNRVEHWIKVCVGIVQFTKDTEPSSLEDLLVNLVNDETYTVERLLGDIGLPEEALFYANHKFQWERDESEDENEDKFDDY